MRKGVKEGGGGKVGPSEGGGGAVRGGAKEGE